MFRRLLDETEIIQIITDNGGGSGGGITYTPITWTELIALPIGNRVSYYEITDADTNNNNIVYGQIKLNPIKTTFYYQNTQLILVQ